MGGTLLYGCLKMFLLHFVVLALVVRKVDNAIHQINHYPVDSVVCLFLILIHWIAIYSVNSVIQPLNN